MPGWMVMLPSDSASEAKQYYVRHLCEICVRAEITRSQDNDLYSSQSIRGTHVCSSLIARTSL
jgi:hypothetical protein